MAERPEFSHRRERRGIIGPFGGRQLLGGGAVVAIVAVLLVVVTTPLGAVNGVGPNAPQATQFVLDPSGQIGVRPGQIPPELKVTRPDGSTLQLTDLTGRPIQLAALRGNGIWLNFWASWCPPCQSETPVLRDVAERYRDRGLVVIGVSVQEASADNVAAYAAKYQLDYTIAADVTGEIYRLYRPPGLPTSIFIGPEGAVHSLVLAPLTESAAIVQVEAVLPVGAAGSEIAPSGPSGSPPAASTASRRPSAAP